MLFILFITSYAITFFNTNFTSTFNSKDFTKDFRWNTSVVENAKNYIYKTNTNCIVNYVSGSQLPYSSFGFLPYNMIDLMINKPQDWCHSIFMDYNKICKTFSDEVMSGCHNYYFSFSNTLLSGIQMVNEMTLQYGNICMNVIILNLKTANKNDKWMWQLLLNYGNFNCYDTMSFMYMFLDEPWRSLFNVSSSQILINGDYHTDNYGNVTFEKYSTYYEYYVARSNIINC